MATETLACPWPKGLRRSLPVLSRLPDDSTTLRVKTRLIDQIHGRWQAYDQGCLFACVKGTKSLTRSVCSGFSCIHTRTHTHTHTHTQRERERERGCQRDSQVPTSRNITMLTHAHIYIFARRYLHSDGNTLAPEILGPACTRYRSFHDTWPRRRRTCCTRDATARIRT